MQHTKFFLAFLTIGALASGAHSAALAPELVMNDRDHKALAKEVQGYYDAMRSSKGILEAFGKVSTAIAKSERKLKGTAPLSLVEDWEQVFFMARAGTYSDRGVKKGKVDETTAKLDRGGEIHFWIHVPSKYSAKKGPYQLLLAIPDKGGDPETLIDTDWIDAEARENTLIVAPRMPADTRLWTKLDPSGPLDGISTIMFTYGEVLKTYAVDVDKVFLAGKGEGIVAALSAARAFPHLFAGVIGRGAAGEVDPRNFRNVPTLFLDGGSHATAFEERIGELGYENCTHVQGKVEADVWSWIDKNERNGYPERLTFHPATPYSLRADWLELVGVNVEEEPSVEVQVDRAANAITVTAERISGVRVYFNDLLVDMDKPVKVVINGAEHEQLLPRNARTMVDLVYNFGDWGRVFTNVMPFDVPASSE